MSAPSFSPARMYEYLGLARRDLWAALEAVPDELLSRPLLDGERFHCIKDLLFHVAAVEDGWLHEDILRVPPVIDGVPLLAATTGGPEYAPVALSALLDYWRAVEARMQAYLATVTGEELARVVTVHDAPDEHYTAERLLWHIMLHEVRHTAQICLLLRQQNITPPSLDLLFYLPELSNPRYLRG
jgi:uncharacterized damage-inducible protein DinB